MELPTLCHCYRHHLLLPSLRPRLAALRFPGLHNPSPLPLPALASSPSLCLLWSTADRFAGGRLPKKQRVVCLSGNCSSDSSSLAAERSPAPSSAVLPAEDGRRWFLGCLFAAAAGLDSYDKADAVSSSRRALRASKIPESEFTTLPNGLKYYDIKVGSGAKAVKGSRVAVHYVAKWRGITFMTSRQGLGVTGGTPYGFDVGQSERGTVLKGLDLGVQGMRVGGQRLLIVPPELAYGRKGVQEIPPNATIELDVELLSIKQNAFGSPVKIVEG